MTGPATFRAGCHPLCVYLAGCPWGHGAAQMGVKSYFMAFTGVSEVGNCALDGPVRGARRAQGLAIDLDRLSCVLACTLKPCVGSAPLLQCLYPCLNATFGHNTCYWCCITLAGSTPSKPWRILWAWSITCPDMLGSALSAGCTGYPTQGGRLPITSCGSM